VATLAASCDTIGPCPGVFSPARHAGMKPLTTILSLPVADPQATANFYAEGLGLETDGVEDGIVAFELPNLSIFFITANE